MPELRYPAPPLADDIASQAVARRVGFTREGVLHSLEDRDGRRPDVVMFSLLPEDLDVG